MKMIPASQNPGPQPEVLVTVVGTGTNRYMQKGVEYEVHPSDTDLLIKAGHAKLKAKAAPKEKVMISKKKEKVTKIKATAKKKY